MKATKEKFDWKTIAVHDEKNIKGFFGNYRYLSNFHVCEVEYEGVMYPSSENAYQAAKIISSMRKIFTTCTPSESKRKWQALPKVDSDSSAWNERRLTVMTPILIDKFTRHGYLKTWLLETGSRYLEETNWWEDVFWGVDHKLGGENNLGKLLMNIRDDINVEILENTELESKYRI